MLVSSKFIIYNQVSMSIPNLIHKIKSRTSLDKTTIMYLLIIVGVGISSFGLGRISISDGFNNYKEIQTETKGVDENKDIANTKIPLVQTTGKKMYLASKNGKMYYSIGCSGANRIKQENQIWFSSKIDAEKSGYTLSSSCRE